MAVNNQQIFLAPGIQTEHLQCPCPLGPGSHHFKAFETSLEGLCCLQWEIVFRVLAFHTAEP
jgi:hypothetical protein